MREAAAGVARAASVTRWRASVVGDPLLGAEERAEVAADLEVAVLHPHLGAVGLVLLGVEHLAALVGAVAVVVAEAPHDDHALDGLVVVVALALLTEGAGLEQEAVDAAVHLALDLVDLDDRLGLAGLVVDGLPRAVRAGPAGEGHDARGDEGDGGGDRDSGELRRASGQLVEKGDGHRTCPRWVTGPSVPRPGERAAGAMDRPRRPSFNADGEFAGVHSGPPWARRSSSSATAPSAGACCRGSRTSATWSRPCASAN